MKFSEPSKETGGIDPALARTHTRLGRKKRRFPSQARRAVLQSGPRGRARLGRKRKFFRAKQKGKNYV